MNKTKSTLNCTRLHAKLIVADVLNCWQEAIPVFLRHRMACIGCPMSSFETLEGAAGVYGLNPADFLDELQAAIAGRE